MVWKMQAEIYDFCLGWESPGSCCVGGRKGGDQREGESRGVEEGDRDGEGERRNREEELRGGKKGTERE